MADMPSVPCKRLAPASAVECRSDGSFTRHIFFLHLASLLAIALTGCLGTGPILVAEKQHAVLPDSVELARTPFFPQDDYQCGPAALAMILADTGLDVIPEDLVQKVYIPDRQGSLQIEMLAATRSMGRLPYVIDPEVHAVMAELAAGRPVLVLQNLGLRIAPVWHYAVVAGYDVGSDEFVLRSGVVERRLTSASKFVSTWEDSDNWAMIALRPGELPENPDQERYLTAVAAMESVGQVNAAKKAYEIATKTWPESSLTLFGLANTNYATGELEKAERLYRRLLETEPHHAAALNNLAMVLLDQGRCREALETIDRARSITSPPTNPNPTLEETRGTIIERCANSSPFGSPGT